MKKLAVLLLTLSLFALAAPSARAQSKDTERWVCLQADHCLKPESNCSAAAKGNGHKAKLSAKPGFEPLVGQPTYVVVCIGTDNGQVCTSGNAATDNQVYGKDNVSTLSPLGFKFEGLFKADGTTAVANPADWSGPYEWGDSLDHGHMHTWFALNYWDPQKAATGGEGGQQQGTFDFETAQKDCVKINWDPYGRVFDAGTLEPVNGASVTLQVKKGDKFVTMTAADLMGGNLINPQATLEDGQFNFVVPDGDYKLITAGSLTDTTGLDPNYTKAYSDIYPDATGEVITQKGTIQHRDIPVATRNTNTVPKLMEYFYQTTSDGMVIIEGRTSHPLTKLIVKTSKVTSANPGVKTPYRTVGTFTADKLGKFRIEVDQNKFEKTADYTEIFSDVELVKTDLRLPGALKPLDRVVSWFNSLVGGVEAQTKSVNIKFEPIPQYIEGYAYDAAGKPLPNATVGVYVSFSKKPYATTTTDAAGFFKFTSEYLPNNPYTLQYTTATGAKVNVTTSSFIAQNQKYLAEKNVNPYVGKDLKNNIAPTAAKVSPAPSGRAVSPNTGGRETGEKGSPEADTKAQQLASQALPLIVALVVLVVAAVIGVVVFLKKRQTPNIPPPAL